MSGRVTAVFGVIVLVCLAGVDYGTATSARAQGQPLGVAEHVMIRLAQVRAAVGLAPPAAVSPSVPAVPTGPATALIEARLAEAQATPDTAAPAPVAAKQPKPQPNRKAKAKKKGAITVGKGTCAKRGGAGKFCTLHSE